MAVNTAAVASPRQLYQGQPSTTAGSVYTAPAASANVTSPSATAYITEILLCNTTGSAANVSIFVGGTAPANAIVNNLTVSANDTVTLTGLKTMIPAGSSINASQVTSGAITATISGAEVQ